MLYVHANSAAAITGVILGDKNTLINLEIFTYLISDSEIQFLYVVSHLLQHAQSQISVYFVICSVLVIYFPNLVVCVLPFLVISGSCWHWYCYSHFHYLNSWKAWT